MLSAELPLPADPRSASAARRFLTDTLDRWDCRGYADTAELLLSELVGNAILHARTELTVRILQLPDALRLEVIDASARMPTQRRYGLDATTGRGLALVAALARCWGSTTEGAGKVVWCELSEDSRHPTDIDVTALFDVDAFADLEGDLDEGASSGGAERRAQARDSAPARVGAGRAA